jgi:hypothetical protein
MSVTECSSIIAHYLEHISESLLSVCLDRNLEDLKNALCSVREMKDRNEA